MGEPVQFAYDLKEVASLLLKSSNIHEGKWVLGIEFTVAVGAMGTQPDQGFPGVVVAANKLNLSAVNESTPQPIPPNLVFDASILNPK